MEFVIIPLIVGILLAPIITTFCLDVFYYPVIDVEVTEIVDIPEGIWRTFIYWKKQYSLYEITISNRGTAGADDVRVYFDMPGLIYCVQSTDVLGIEFDTDPVAFNTYEYYYDPIFIGKIHRMQFNTKQTTNRRRIG